MQNLSYENEFYLHVNENSFSYERPCEKTRFEKEVPDNSEMAYYFTLRWDQRSPSSQLNYLKTIFKHVALNLKLPNKPVLKTLLFSLHAKRA